SFVTDDVHGYMPQELKFTRDDAGNVTSVFDATTQGGTAKPDHQCFAYDGNRRMTEAWTPKTADCATSGRTVANLDGAAPYWTSYTYTGAGQRKTETQHTTSGDKTTTYTYDDPADSKPHTLDRTTGARAGTYTYDSTGNTTSRPGPSAQQTLAWNTEGDLAKLTEGTKETSYLYDAGGSLLIRRAKGDGETVLYLGAGTELHLTTKGTTKTASATRSYTANGQTIAVRTATSGVSGTKLSFLAADHHGTSSIALAASTYAVTKRYNTPFGAPRGTKPTSWPDDKTFLGKPADDTTGLTHIGAREYDPITAQFISVDPILATDQHQSLNGYSYAGNSPITQSDPTGLCFADVCGVGVPKGRVNFDDDKPGEIITDGPIDPGNPGAGSCHHGSCGKIHYNATGTANASGSTAGGAVAGPGDTNGLAQVGFGWGHAFSQVGEWGMKAGYPLCWFGMEDCEVADSYDDWSTSHGADSGNANYQQGSSDAYNTLLALLGGTRGGMAVEGSAAEGGAGLLPAAEAEGKTGGNTWTADLSHITGKTAASRNRAVKIAIAEDFPNLRFSHQPVYSPFVSTGIAKPGHGTQLGAESFVSRAELRDSLVHEELHHRWFDRGIPAGTHHPRDGSGLSPRFYGIISRYKTFRGWQ
ncbi:RHS repeat-associated core domain-containing protein, partial [Streptomyces sp. NPDC059168]|uniref:RHS repeat-associated core domain-containing protein n=1 Tax=Streptomyces sp. NPDC059168 TaxID=3346753 RepID=UPI0036A3FC17